MKDELTGNGFIRAKGPTLKNGAVLQNQISLFHPVTSLISLKKMVFSNSFS
jgi:hypothetical protein